MELCTHEKAVFSFFLQIYSRCGRRLSWPHNTLLCDLIKNCNNYSCLLLECDSSLSSKQLREQWEKQFYKTCMLPVLQDTQKHLRKALHLIANDDSQGIKK